MGGHRTSRHTWGTYAALFATTALVITAASIRPSLSAQPRCSPLVLDVAGLPGDARRDLLAAAARVTEASGVPFIAVERSVQGDAITVDVATNLPPASPGRRTVGYTTILTNGPRIVGGRISVDVSLTTGGGFGRRSDLGVVFMHELGHVLGVVHSGDARDLMYSAVQDGPTVWSDHDRSELAAAGARKGCDGKSTEPPRS